MIERKIVVDNLEEEELLKWLLDNIDEIEKDKTVGYTSFSDIYYAPLNSDDISFSHTEININKDTVERIIELNNVPDKIREFFVKLKELMDKEGVEYVDIIIY